MFSQEFYGKEKKAQHASQRAFPQITIERATGSTIAAG